MAQARSQMSTAALRAITYRLTSTPTKQLPYITPQIAASLWACKDILSCSAESLKQIGEASVVVHRFKTQLSTLLQDRTIEGRWAAVVLIKAAIEAGGVETLSKSNGWVRNLLGVLKKPDPSSTRSLAILTLTRIFMLTWDYSNLIREITTPALPAFVSTCISNAENPRCSSEELQTVLEAFATLLPRHPTIFRTNETQIRSLLGKILSQTLSIHAGIYYSHDHQLTAQEVLVLLHHTAPKQGAAEKWSGSLKSSIASAHEVCDQLFRSVIENWQSTTGVRPSLQPHVLMQGELESEGDALMNLSGWRGVSEGSGRLLTLMGIMKAHILSSTGGPVSLGMGSIVDLLARLFSLRQPYGKQDSIQPNDQISREEREALFLTLPDVHVAGSEIVEAVLYRFGNAAFSMLQPLLTQITWVFGAESNSSALRTATYRVLESVLELQGLGYAKEDIADIEGILRSCCRDLLPEEASSVTTPQQSGTATDMNLQSSRGGISHATDFPSLLKAAHNLLSIALYRLDPRTLPKRLRQLMDFTAAMMHDKGALVASVLNPSTVRGHASLLPLLVRHHPESSEVEALLRPRLPPIRLERPTEDEEDEDMIDEQPVSTADDIALENEILSPDRQEGLLDVHEEEDEPTAGLLSALDQQLQASAQRHPQDNAHTMSLRSAAVSEVGQLDQIAAGKRSAIEEADAERVPKRSKPLPTPETPASEPMAPLSSATPVAATMPVAPEMDQPQSSFVTAPEPSQQQSSAIATANAETYTGTHPAIAPAEEDDLDGSDFEMPPLTMESDTDSGDEAAEDDEE